ncbi:4a-hydroxytetrahydrobiopterin dehydratase [Ectothiorhodospira mobilis]|jgi:4a-hydroxytetrahydrobiopterin dehydratase|uniref:Putative pterin-4-alpha-carbinolamine dehydratase n=1 Tax=Ectothiorhodospira mobilis TaxID=195064 RepID=A0A1I4RSY1_ECTMO|nr:4a-hydroxytetrahydrobiopterin dehydratase [Ectothiorhodospira mobilis]MCG5534980.1 4a-hydroxytetrahydrobiopterin dehydratase [Ectothiorhodospira mobilis]SFM55278.1 pterin-4-alpha-carbinolamine dehydratase [Ectothiorhodospira mobilis]
MHTDLHTRHCTPCEGGTQALEPEAARERLQALDPEWSLDDAGRVLRRTLRFEDFHHTMAFVNAVAWIAHRQDHHPDLEVGYNTCRVHFSTHAIGGLSDNDFICAARVDRLLQD